MTVYLNTETTCLSPPKDEILEIGILDDQGRTLVDSLVRPVNHRTWPGAIRGISPGDVDNAPTLDELISGIFEAVRGKEVVIYNVHRRYTDKIENYLVTDNQNRHGNISRTIS